MIGINGSSACQQNKRKSLNAKLYNLDVLGDRAWLSKRLVNLDKSSKLHREPPKECDPCVGIAEENDEPIDEKANQPCH